MIHCFKTMKGRYTMKNLHSIITALVIMLIATMLVPHAAFADEKVTGVLGEVYEFDDISAKLVAYHVEEIDGSTYIYVEFEFINNGTAPLTFENSAWVLVTQDDEECYIHTTELPNINLIDACKPDATTTYINAYKLNDLKTEVIVDVYPASQLLAGWGKRKGEVFYHIDIVNEPKAIADGYEWKNQ